MRAVALLLAGGRGQRLGSASQGKAFAELAGRPLIAHAVDLCAACPEVQGLVIVVPRGAGPEAERAARGSPKLLAIVEGGDTRQESVRLGLARVPPEFDAVVCHDAARPLATPALFSAVLAALARADGAVAAVPVAETLKRVRGAEVLETLNREELVVAQTPQAFRRSALEEAHAAAELLGVAATDDAALLERLGRRVVVVPGDAANLKVTRPPDLAVAAALLADETPEQPGIDGDA